MPIDIKNWTLRRYFPKKVIMWSDILINELRVTRLYPYEFHLLQELRVTFCIRVTSYWLLHELRITFYIRVTVYCLFHELGVTFAARVYKLLFIARVASYWFFHKLRVAFCIRVTSYFLTRSYSEDKDDKAVYDNKVMIKNYSKPCFRVISIYSSQRKNLFSTLWYLYTSFMYHSNLWLR